MKPDNSTSSGGTTMTDEQRKAAAAIARQRVLAAFKQHPENYTDIETPEIKQQVAEDIKIEQSGQHSSESPKQALHQTLANDTTQPKVSERQWHQYHSAWQSYYRKYYENYYTSAVRKVAASQAKQAPSQKVVVPKVEDEEKTKEQAFDSLRDRIRARASDHAQKIRKSRHFIPILAGLVVILAFVFLQYNRWFIATVSAYIMPTQVSSNITEIDPTVSANVGPDPKLIIPKINIEVPVVFGIGNDYKSQQEGMNHGVTHFAIPGASSTPGQVGNTVLSGHSSNDVFDNGSYKFIFAQLDRLDNGDTIYINYEGARYTYAVTKKEVVLPTDVSKLVYQTDKPVLTLITCTPLGTAKYRLLVTAEQVSPSPNDAKPSGSAAGQKDTTEMPSNSPTFIERIINFFTGKG
ncbi:MAG: class D sortase [Candidatus Nomurabacteria bacterium]|jgi:sortase A|nr:class D sortase [Candidatus Nomurabacteria bacterium]